MFDGWDGCVKSLRKALLWLVGILRHPGLPGTFRQNRGGRGHSSAAPDGFQRHGKQQWGKESPHRSRPMVRYSTGQQAVSLMFAEGFRMPRGKRPCSFHILTCGFLCNYTQALKVYFNTLHTQYDIITEKSIYLTKIPNYGPRGRTAQCATRTVGARSITPEMAQISPSFGAWQDPFTSAKHGSPGLVLSRGFPGEISRLLARLLLLLAAVHVLYPLFQITRDVFPDQKENKDSGVFFCSQYQLRLKFGQKSKEVVFWNRYHFSICILYIFYSKYSSNKFGKTSHMVKRHKFAPTQTWCTVFLQLFFASSLRLF